MASNATASSSSASVTDVTVTSTVSSSVSSAVVTETSTVTSGSTSFISTTEATSASTTIVSSVYVTPSTTYVPASTSSTTPVEVTSFITITPTSDGVPVAPTVITITSTAANSNPTTSTSHAAGSSSAQPSALSPSGADRSGTSSGLSSGGKIAIAVVIPLVVIAAACIFGLLFYKRRQRRKNEEAMRQKEMTEYVFNPNNDPTLAPVGAAYVDNGSESADETSGYRGWGNTSTAQRKPSTTMGSGSRNVAGGVAMSESSSNPGGYGYSGPGSDHLSGETMAAGAVAGGIGGAVAGRRRSHTDINRGPSNASSAYSTGHALSELSDDPAGGNVPGPYYHEEVPYNIYNEQHPNGGGYGGGQPVIQNVGARRDTRIERVPTFPQQQQQGNAGIAQNF